MRLEDRENCSFTVIGVDVLNYLIIKNKKNVNKNFKTVFHLTLWLYRL